MVAVAIKLQNKIRNLLGIRRARVTPRRTSRPPSVGARIFCEDLRMSVQIGLDRELWRWLQDQGWREVTARPDRRTYRDISSRWMTQLIDAAPEQREAVLQRAIEDARAPATSDDRQDS
jgi:hypothetical protein